MYLGEEGAHVLANALIFATSLKDLYLYSTTRLILLLLIINFPPLFIVENNIGEVGASAIASVLPMLSALEMLYLRGNIFPVDPLYIFLTLSQEIILGILELLQLRLPFQCSHLLKLSI